MALRAARQDGADADADREVASAGRTMLLRQAWWRVAAVLGVAALAVMVWPAIRDHISTSAAVTSAPEPAAALDSYVVRPKRLQVRARPRQGATVVRRVRRGTVVRGVRVVTEGGRRWRQVTTGWTVTGWVRDRHLEPVDQS